MGLIELTYWRIRIEIFTAAIENFSKISRVEGIFVQEIRVWFLPFFNKNGKLATNETPNIAFFVRAVNQKIWDQSTKVPVTNVKVPVKTIFRNARENFGKNGCEIFGLARDNFRWYAREKSISARDEIQKKLCHGHFGVSRGKKKLGEEEGRG